MSPRVASLRMHLALLAAVAAVAVWSVIRPHDLFTWFLEAVPVPIAAALIAFAYPRWRFTPLALCLVALHAVILLVGAKYTYAEVPLFNWLRDEHGLARNYYDRVGHFAQGFVPAIVAREILLRRQVVKRGAWLFVFVTATCLAISALYEFIEWWTAAATGAAAEAFLGTQGDPWDTQWDMFLALCGAIAAQLVLGRWHDRLLGVADPPSGPVTLREIVAENIDLVGELRVEGDQRYHVASIAKTIWQAKGNPKVWMRAIYAGDVPVGFIAMSERAGGEVYIARLLVDWRYQGRGYGKQAIGLMIERARSLAGCNRVTLSYVPSNKAVASLYQRFGFRDTGKADEDGELEMQLDLA